jgi:hypothetical protein
VEREANPPHGLNARWDAARRDAIAGSQPLLKLTAGRSVKDTIEGALNAWKDDPMSYLRQHAEIDAEAARPGPKASEALDQARKRLVELGIYQPKDGGGWELHSVRAGDKPVLERLTRYERLELQRFHLEILNRVLLPDVLVRRYLFNYVDDRMAKYPPLWMTCEYGEGSVPTVRTRKTDEARIPLPLEDP